MSAVFDAIVIGGGPAGSAAAALLARAGREVLLCDAARFPRHKICGEFVPPAALRQFADLGVLPEIEALRPRRHVGMAVIAPGGAEVLGRYDHGAACGLSLRRYDLDETLLRNAGRCGARVLQGWRAAGFERGRDGIFDVELVSAGAVPVRAGPGSAAAGGPAAVPDRAAVRARAIVGADGRNSFVARRLGLRRAEPRHRKWAVMGHFLGVESPADHGEMIVTSYGYCGINPLPGGLANVCVVVDPAAMRRPIPGGARLRDFFQERIADHPLTRRRMARAEPAGSLRATGPMACRAARSVADGVLLVGDAAGFYDPFTGEGIAMALRGTEMAAEVLLEALSRGDLGARALEPYETGRRAAFGPRLRLDRVLQGVLARPRLADWVARRLRRDQDLADLLARVTGDMEDAAALFRPRFLARLLLA
ncbi:MAG: NAD(P)/FAD-dependent oxidoreductase [Acidobacteria bacterium]|nr:NAD(P)/FAD-dependent oxidoreductase [Acidobacteriota bacterium]